MNGHRLWISAALSLLLSCGGNPDNTDAGPPVAIAAQQWSFDPATLTVEKGTTVSLALTSKDVHHRFYLPDFGVDVDLTPGMTTNVTFTPTETGTFPFRCEYYCGKGHEGMVGRVVVQ